MIMKSNLMTFSKLYTYIFCKQECVVMYQTQLSVTYIRDVLHGMAYLVTHAYKPSQTSRHLILGCMECLAYLQK